MLTRAPPQVASAARLLLKAPALVAAHGGVGGTLVKARRVVRDRGWLSLAGAVRRNVVFELHRMDGRREYADWVRRYDTFRPKGLEILRQRGAQLSGPLISVLMPTYNTPEGWLRQAISSVLDQAYPRWELCIADDASDAPHVRPLLEAFAALDPRVHVTFRAARGHIAAASNTALAMAQGSHVALLDHDDELSPDALLRVAEEISVHPGADIIYSDEDKIDPAGRRCDPYFKPDWNPDLFLSHNLISHLGVYRAALVKAIGGFRAGFEGSQDYDLALRCLSAVHEPCIRHIPNVLYHWRMHAGSTAASAQAKAYAADAAQRAVADFLRRSGAEADVMPAPEAPGMLRVKYRLRAERPLVTLVIPTRNRVALLRTCIDSILTRTSYAPFDIIIVDNGSDDDETLAYLEALAHRAPVTVLRDEGAFNYPRLNNLGVEHARGEVIGLLNNDVEVLTPDWLEEMVRHALRPGIGAVGARLWYPDGTLQHGGVLLGVGGVANHAHKFLRRGEPGQMGRAVLTQNFSAVTAACLVVRKSIYLKVGGLDEALPVAFNDVDFCLRLLTKGYRNVWVPYAELLHHESASRGGDDSPEQRARFAEETALMHRRWADRLRTDPAYNPNLTLDRSDFSLAWPPRTQTARHVSRSASPGTARVPA